jgi:hypothetical protein
MVENALYNALDTYNANVATTNLYDKNWGSLFNFIDTDDTDLLAEYQTRKAQKPKPFANDVSAALSL